MKAVSAKREYDEGRKVKVQENDIQQIKRIKRGTRKWLSPLKIL